MEGGLKGRFSAGAEIYFSAKEKSAGVSTGVRFTTLPDATPPSYQLPSATSTSVASTVASAYMQSQPPTTLTAVFNPMMGHISGAYAARVSRDLSLCSRFDFNIYSYLSEWTMGAEWWIGGRAGTGEESPLTDHERGGRAIFDQPSGVVKARISTNAVSIELPIDDVVCSITAGRVVDVGRSSEQRAREPRCCLRSDESFEANTRYRPGTGIFQLFLTSHTLLSTAH